MPADVKKLANNKELYDYLVALSALLQARGADSLAANVLAASRQSAALSTEFLGESRIALRKVTDADEVLLSDAERAEITDILTQLSDALDNRKPQ